MTAFQSAIRVACFGLMFVPTLAAAERIDDFHPLVHDTDRPQVLSLDGDITIRTPVMLDRALKRFPQITEIHLSSRGG
ncbi:hypothetical protein [Antarctobacter jejuensis]|uniref:hypothetical protein n=1 Tax=Antarctobacter jejuensis TaxID=1439938 RepID=UPI003FD53C8A